MPEIKKNRKGSVLTDFIGVDTETYNGEPISFQISYKDKSDIVFCNKNNITEKFLFQLFTIVNNKTKNYYLIAHNLEFDLSMLFFRYKEKFVEPEFDFKIKNVRIKGFLGKPSYCQIIKNNVYVHFIDLYNYFPFPLKNVAEIFNLKKLDTPEGLGKKKFNKNNKYFIEYAKNDAYLCQKIAEKINEFSESYDVRFSISISQLSERIFRHCYLKNKIDALPGKILNPALRSYHGGKNGFYVKPGWYYVYIYDIVSAYPYAMSNIPDFENGEYYQVKNYEKDFPGIYKISGKVKNSKYPIIYDDDFNPVEGNFSNIWITSYELEQVFKYRIADINIEEGFIFVEEKRKGKTALQNFIHDFFEKKNNETDKLKRFFYKIVLNSLYGKFIQMRNRQVIFDVEDEKFIFKNVSVGKMFNPFIASLITGYVRAYLFELEYKFRAIHSATDSIMTLKPIPKKYLSSDLGGLKFEAEGKALILRNKLYVILNDKDEIIKFALHGFQGTPEQLLKMYKTKNLEYEFIRMNRLKESFRQNIKPFVFERKKAILNIDL